MTSLQSPLWRAIEAFYASFAPNPPPRVRDPNKPMQVICVGLPRSGTESLQQALLILGYDYTYHGWDMLNETPHRMNSWVSLARRKFYPETSSSQRPISAADFDAVLGHAVAVTDAAANCFAAELIAAYPDAKVILNERADINKWHASILSNIVAVNEDWWKWFLCWFNADLWWMWHTHQRILWPALFHSPYYTSLRSGVEPYGKSIHDQHSAMICKLLPKGRLLEWNVEDGWDGLCEFLGKDRPEEGFPRTNDRCGFRKRVEADLEGLGKRAVGNLVMVLGLFAVVVGALVWVW